MVVKKEEKNMHHMHDFGSPMMGMMGAMMGKINLRIQKEEN